MQQTLTLKPDLAQVHKHALELARDTYGNYVIQHSLQHGDAPQRWVPLPGCTLKP